MPQSEIERLEDVNEVKPKIIVCDLEAEDYIELDGLILVDRKYISGIK